MNDAPPRHARAFRRRPLAIAELSFAGALVLATIWLFTADLGFLAPRLEAAARTATGRDVRIGRLSLHLGRHADLHVESLELPSASWDDGPALLRLERLDARIDLLALLGGTLQLDALELEGARVHLLRTREQGANWRFRARSAAERADDSGGLPLAIAVRSVRASDLQLSYDDPQREPVVVTIDALTRDATENEGGVLQLRGAVDERPLTLDGMLGSGPSLATGEEIAFRLEGRFERLLLEAEGAVDGRDAAHRPRLGLSLRGPDARELERLLGLPARVQGGVDLHVALLPREGGPLDLELRGHLGAARVDLAAEIEDARTFERIDFSADASGPELRRLLALIGADRPAAGPFGLHLRGRRDGPLLQLDEARLAYADASLVAEGSLPRLPTFAGGRFAATLQGADLRRLLQLLGREVGTAGPFTAELSVSASDDGRDRLTARVETAHAALRVRGVAGPDADALRLEVEGEGGDLRTVAELRGLGRLPRGAFDLTGALVREDGVLRLDGPMAVSVGDADASLEGAIGLGAGAVGTALSVELTVPDPAPLELPRMLARTVGSLPVTLAGRWRIEAGGHHFDDVVGTVGATRVALQGLVQGAAGSRSLALDLDLAGPRLEEIDGALEVMDLTPGPFELLGRIEIDGAAVQLEALRLLRQRGQATFDARLARPLSERAGRIAVVASGPDLAAFGGRFGAWTPAPAPFEIDLGIEGSGPNWRIDALDLRYADARVFAEGETNVDADAAPELRAEVEIPSLARLGTLDGRRFLDLPAEASGTITSRAGVLNLDALRLRLGDGRAEGHAVWIPGDVPRVEVSLRTEQLAWMTLLEPIRLETAGDERLVPDVTLPLGLLRAVEGALDLHAEGLEIGEMRFRDLDLRATLEGGRLEIDRLAARGLAGHIEARGSLDASVAPPRLHTEAAARGLAVGLFSAPDDDDFSRGDLDLDLQAQGEDLRELFASLEGVLLLDVRGGRLQSDRLQRILLGDFFGEILSTVTSGDDGREYTEIDCAIFPLRFADGRLDNAPASLIRTDEVTLRLEGEVSLEDERIELFARSRPRRTLTVSAAELINPYVKFVGTLSRPRAALDERGALLAGGAAALSGGLSILGRMALDRVVTGSNVCARTVESALDEIGSELPDSGLAARASD